MKVVIYNKQPIAFGFSGVLNWFDVIKSLIVVLKDNGTIIELLRENDLLEFRNRETIQGITIPEWIRAYDLTIWKYQPNHKKFVQTYFSNELKN